MIDEKEVLKILKRYEGRMNPTAYFSLEADIVNIKPVEAITKADYENRLKADMVAMLEDLDLQIDELTDYNFDNNFEVTQVQRLIRDKINSLKEGKDVSS